MKHTTLALFCFLRKSAAFPKLLGTAVCACGLLLAGCPATAPAPAPTNRVVLYCSVDDVYARPIIRRIEQDTGLKIDVLYDTEAAKTAGLSNKIRAEKARPQGDVFWSSALLQTLLLEREGLLQSYASPAARDIPAAFKDVNARWTGLGVRARVVVWNDDLSQVAQPLAKVVEEKAPLAERRENSERVSDKISVSAPLKTNHNDTLGGAQFVDPSHFPTVRNLQKAPWNRAGLSGISNPQFGTGSDWVAALATRWGQNNTLRYFKSLKKNGVRVLPGNSVVAEKVARGELLAGMTDTDDYFAQKTKAATRYFIALNDPEMVFVPGTVAILKGAPRPDNARKLVDALLKIETEQQLVDTMTGVIPTRSAVSVSQPELKILAKQLNKAPNDTARWADSWEKIREPLAAVLLP